MITGEKVTTEGKFLLVFCAIILLSPYLIPIPGTGVKVRPDHIIVPIAAWLFLLKGFYDGVRHGPQLFFMAAYVVWMLLVSIYYFAVPPFNAPLPSIADLLGYLDSTLRPLYILIIISALKPTKRDLLAIIRLILIASIPLSLIGVGQLAMDKVRHNPLNHIVHSVYDFGRNDELYWALLENGRSMSTFGQSGTFGIFTLMVFVFAVASLAGGNYIKSKILTIFIVCMSVAGGMASGSKIFVGGSIIFAVTALILLRPKLTRLSRKSMMAIFVLLISMSTVAFFAFSEHTLTELTSLVNPFRIYDTYFSARFGSTFPSEAKLARTGAFYTAGLYPTAGIGLIATKMTADSAIFAVIVTSGFIGLTLFGLSIYSVIIALVFGAMQTQEKDLRILSLAMVILTVIFIGASIGFHVFTQDRVGDMYWITVSILFVHLLPSLDAVGWAHLQELPIISALLRRNADVKNKILVMEKSGG